MNSLERKELRYQRRKTTRANKIKERYNKHGNIIHNFNFHNVYENAKLCTRNVGYKKSTKMFKYHMFSIVGKTCVDIKQDKYKVNKTYHFKINERGKTREIDAPVIKDRLVHKVISRSMLMPIYDPMLIYDNGASCINKGFSFALLRLKKFLSDWYKKYGLEGYVITIDFSKYFENCNHEIIKQTHDKYFKDNYTKKVIEDYLFIGKGLALGVEIAQREAIMYPNKLDKYLTNKGFPIVRYMDDCITICHTLKEANEILKEYLKITNELDIKVNMKKTKITKLGNYFTFCKWKFCLLDTGKVIMVPSKKTIYYQRRKLRKMIKLNLSLEDITISLTSFIAYLNIGMSNKYINLLLKEYEKDKRVKKQKEEKLLREQYLQEWLLNIQPVEISNICEDQKLSIDK